MELSPLACLRSYWRRDGVRRAVSYAGITAAVYLAWYVSFALGSDSNPDTGGFGLTKIFVKIPEFIGVMLILDFQRVFPVPGMGFLVLLALFVWLIRLRVTRNSTPGFSPAVLTPTENRATDHHGR